MQLEVFLFDVFLRFFFIKNYNHLLKLLNILIILSSFTSLQFYLLFFCKNYFFQIYISIFLINFILTFFGIYCLRFFSFYFFMNIKLILVKFYFSTFLCFFILFTLLFFIGFNDLLWKWWNIFLLIFNISFKKRFNLIYSFFMIKK
jgi:hypothetical protein